MSAPPRPTSPARRIGVALLLLATLATVGARGTVAQSQHWFAPPPGAAIPPRGDGPLDSGPALPVPDAMTGVDR